MKEDLETNRFVGVFLFVPVRFRKESCSVRKFYIFWELSPSPGDSLKPWVKLNKTTCDEKEKEQIDSLVRAQGTESCDNSYQCLCP